MTMNNWADGRGDGPPLRDEPAVGLTRRQRQAAIAIGILAGGTGAYAVFASSNQAGTVVLLLTALVFLLIGVEGTPLLQRAGPRSARRRHTAAPDAQRVADLESDAPLSETRLAR